MGVRDEDRNRANPRASVRQINLVWRVSGPLRIY